MNGNGSRNFFKIFIFALIAASIPLTFGFYYLYKKQIGLIKYLELIITHSEKEKAKKNIDVLPIIVPDKARTTTWLDVQKKVKDT